MALFAHEQCLCYDGFTFESVGAILVVAFLIIPAATAYLLTHKLKTMLLLATLIGITSSILGYHLALWLNADLRQYGRCTGVLFIAALAVSRGKRMQISAFSDKQIGSNLCETFNCFPLSSSDALD